MSCIMSNFNTKPDYLKESIGSILNQTFKDFELIIVDDCSSDNSGEILKEFALADNRVKLIWNEKNLGLPKALNVAIANACGEYIARMDTDDVSLPDRFEKQIEYIENNGLDLVGSETNRMDENGDIYLEGANKSYSSETISEMLTLTDCVAHPTWFARRGVFLELNGYRDIKSCEDYDFLLRARRMGFRIGITDNVLLNYRHNPQSISRTNALRQLLTSLYLSKHFDDIDNVSIEDIYHYVEKRCSDKQSKKYAIAVKYYEMFSVEVRKNKFKALSFLVKAFLKSKYVFKDFNRSLKVYKIKKKLGKIANE